MQDARDSTRIAIKVLSKYRACHVAPAFAATYVEPVLICCKLPRWLVPAAINYIAAPVAACCCYPSNRVSSANADTQSGCRPQPCLNPTTAEGFCFRSLSFFSLFSPRERVRKIRVIRERSPASSGSMRRDRDIAARATLRTSGRSFRKSYET